MHDKGGFTRLPFFAGVLLAFAFCCSRIHHMVRRAFSFLPRLSVPYGVCDCLPGVVPAVATVTQARGGTLVKDFYGCFQKIIYLCHPQIICRSKSSYQPFVLQEIAGMVELVDTLDLGSNAARRGGSSPFSRTRDEGNSFVSFFQNIDAKMAP